MKMTNVEAETTAIMESVAHCVPTGVFQIKLKDRFTCDEAYSRRKLGCTVTYHHNCRRH